MNDSVLDRELRHMAWANQQLIARLAEQPDSALALTAPQNEWSAGRILVHLVNAANGYAARLEGLPRQPQGETPTSVSELAALAERLAAADARLRAHAEQPEGMAAYAGDDARYPRSTVIAQAIHHATEHRAQIAGALATNGNNAIDLDAMDFWEFTDAEGAASA
ncbi:MAG TPA: DinB family protein [Candidatus Limnocylindrales bacterium]|nr:DinB family protein [Candidatus Limnocylindrales bacterium]